MGRKKLRRSPPGSTSWVYIDKGSLVIEFYDHGTEAEEVWGNDVAYLLRVALEHKAMVMAALTGQRVEPGLWPKKLDARLLGELERRFGNYFEVKTWLDEAEIPYTHHFDSWA